MTQTKSGSRLAKPLALLWERSLEEKTPEFFDIVIVGSGYGGSMAAYQFAGCQEQPEGGPARELKVLMLERGNEYLAGEFPDRFAELPRHVRLADRDGSRTRFNQQGLFDLRLGDDVSTLVANGLGGGSLINAGVLLQPNPKDFERGAWRKLLERLIEGGVFNEAQKLLGGFCADGSPNTVGGRGPLTGELKKTAALKALAGEKHAGAFALVPLSIAMTETANSAGVKLPACTMCGDCLSGCNVGAKDSLDVNLLRRAALHEGFEIFTGASVLSLRRGPNLEDAKKFNAADSAPLSPHWVLRVAHTDPTLQAREPNLLYVRARRVVLAAGTLGSTEILLRSRSDELVFSSGIGARFSCNGDNIAAVHRMANPVQGCAAETLPADEPGREVGPTITASVHFGQGTASSYHVQEFAVPAPLQRLFGEAVTTAAVLNGLTRADRLPYGSESAGTMDPLAVNTQALNHTLVVGVIGHDDAAGVLMLPTNLRPADRPPQQGTLRVRWPDARYGCKLEASYDELGRLVSGLAPDHTAAPELLANPLWRLLPKGLEQLTSQPRGPVLTVHPLGGISMQRSAASEPRCGAAAQVDPPPCVDDCGRLYNCRVIKGDDWFGSLVVLDGSIIPGSLGVNPALTIATIALDASRRLMGTRGWNLHEPLAVDPTPAYTDRAFAPRPPHPKPHATPVPTRVQMVERLSGPLVLRLPGSLKTARYQAELTLACCETDLAALMSTLDRKLDVDATLGVSSLRLFDANDWFAQDLRLMSDAQRAPFIRFEAPVSGTVRLLHREQSRRWQRTVRSVLAWLCNRGWRDMWQAVSEPKRPKTERAEIGRGQDIGAKQNLLVKIWRWLCDLLSLASHAGEVRRFDYALELGAATERSDAGLRALMATRVSFAGEKRLTYNRRANPWTQLMRLTITSLPGLDRTAPAVLELDTRFLAAQGAPLLRVTQQQDAANALADMVSFLLYTVRLLVSVHLWTFRKPDTPRHDEPQRLPGPIAGLPVPEVTELDVDRPTAGGAAVKVRLTRYPRPQAANLPPLVMIHGYSVSGNTFTHSSLKPSAAEYFWHDAADGSRQGREIWVIDLRTSAGMPTATAPWSLEQPALVDIPAAMLHIRNASGRRVDVFAHCIGCAMLSIALLTDERQVRSGRTQLGSDTWLTSEQLGVLAAFNGPHPVGGSHPCINRIVLSQKGPLLRYTDANVLRAWIMQTMRWVLLEDDYQFRPPRQPGLRDELFDRLLASLPYPDADYDVANPRWPWKRTRWTTTRHRMDALYGRDFNAENMLAPTLDAIDDLFGPIHLATVSQTIHFARFSTVTNQRGRGEFVTRGNLHRRWAGIPTFAVHGADNGLADVTTQSLLRENLQRAGVPFESHIFAAMGHQDCLIGRRSEEVFAAISGFLEKKSIPPAPAYRDACCVYGLPWVGPRIDWDDAEPKTASALEAAPALRIACMSRPDQGQSRLVLVPAWRTLTGEVTAMHYEACMILGNEGTSEQWLFAEVSQHDLAELERCAGQEVGAECGWLALHEYDPQETTALPMPQPQTQPKPTSDPVAVGQGAMGARNLRNDGPGSHGSAPELALPGLFFSGRTSGPPRPQLPHEVLPAATQAAKEPGLRSMPMVGSRTAATAVRHEAWSRFVESGGLATIDALERNLAFVSCADLRRARQMIDAVAAVKPFALALGSCQYPANLVDGQPATRSLERLSSLLPQTDLVLFVGDQIYADATAGVADPTRRDELYDQPNERALQMAPMRDILRQRPVRMLLDDHEMVDNWEPMNSRVAALRPNDDKANKNARYGGLSAWGRYQRMREGKPISGDQPFNFGGYPFFLLDTRTRRSARGSEVPVDEVQLLHVEQRTALENWLKKHRDQVKFVATPALLLPPRLATKDDLADVSYRGGTIANDGWDGYPVTLAWLLELLAREGIGRTVFLSGDEHHALCCEAQLKTDGGAAVQLISVHGSALYAPYPFANGRPQHLMPDGHVRVGSVNVNLHTTFAPPGDGFVHVNVVQPGCGGAALEVSFCKSGVALCPKPVVFQIT